MGMMPLDATLTGQLSQAVVQEARRTLVGRRFIGVWGPLGTGVEAVLLERFGPDRDAEIDMVGKKDPEPIVGGERDFLRVPVLYKDFVLHWRDIAFAKQHGAPLDTTRAVRAAHFVADREDQLIFNGDARFGLQGLLNAEGRTQVARSDWQVYGNAYKDVVHASEQLLKQNHHRPFALAVSAMDYAKLVQQREGQYAAEIHAIRGICEDGVYSSPAIPDGHAVVLSTGDQNLDLAVTEDLTVTFLGEEDQDYPFRVYECLTLRIKRPQAICTIERDMKA